jgi:hypothetical protein
MRPWVRDSLRVLAIGSVVGLVVLGAGGRLAMAAIQLQTTGGTTWTLGGSVTVVFLGAVSGLAGAALALVAELVGRKLRAPPWTSYVLLAALLFLVTMRGLRGSPEIATWYFYPLVAIYGLLFVLARRRDQSQRA